MNRNLQIFNLMMTLAVGGKEKAPARTGAKGIFHDATYKARADRLQHQ
jgi:hypothetical protein